MIKNIIFDVGKVLVEWEPEQAMARLGMDAATVDAVADATVRMKDWDEADRGALTPEELLLHFIEKAPEYEKEIRDFWEHIGMAIYQYDYVKEWMQALKEHGYHLYILSNYGAWTYEHTKEALSFVEDVDGALFSFQVKQIKPEPEIYRTLLARYDLKADECVFLDDRAENIEGAKACGIHGIRFTSFEQAKQSLREYGVEV
ncbi:MAG: HAD family phosphatase [Roseburia sp.]|nr:HAD family phosphatase [Roseburia sp.]